MIIKIKLIVQEIFINVVQFKKGENMDIMKGLLKTINNPYAGIAEDGIIGGDISGYIDTGIYTFNALISGKMIDGGFPKGKIVALAGDKATGKTYILINTFKTYLDNNKDGLVILFESEGAISKKMLKDRGVDTTRVNVFPVNTIEEFRNQISLTLEYFENLYKDNGKYPNIFIALDSLGMLSTDFEMNDAISGDSKSDMGRRAKLVKSTFRSITLKLSILQIAMCITNHTYSSMSAYSGKAMGGGTGLEYASSIIVFLSKSKNKDNKSKIKNLSGNNITFRLEKGRLTVEGCKITTDLDFKKGINRHAGILPVLIESKLFQKKGAWISYNGENVAQGDAKFYENIDDILTDDIKKDVFPMIENQFLYGVNNGND